MPGRLKAFLFLAWALVRTFFVRLFGGGRQGIAAFRENYDADRLPPVTPDERLLMSSFGRCVACELCDRGEGERIEQSQGAYRGVMAIVLAGGRSMPDFRAAAASLTHVPEGILAEKEQLCPTGVPIAALTRFVRSKAAEVGYSLPAPRPSDDSAKNASSTAADV